MEAERHLLFYVKFGVSKYRKSIIRVLLVLKFTAHAHQYMMARLDVEGSSDYSSPIPKVLITMAAQGDLVRQRGSSVAVLLLLVRPGRRG
jgi:hypothetical protein